MRKFRKAEFSIPAQMIWTVSDYFLLIGWLSLGQKKIEVSEVFDAKRAPLIVLVTKCATETLLVGYNLPISSTNLKLLT